MEIKLVSWFIVVILWTLFVRFERKTEVRTLKGFLQNAALAVVIVLVTSAYIGAPDTSDTWWIGLVGLVSYTFAPLFRYFVCLPPCKKILRPFISLNNWEFGFFGFDWNVAAYIIIGIVSAFVLHEKYSPVEGADFFWAKELSLLMFCLIGALFWMVMSARILDTIGRWSQRPFKQ
jgi:hypothetical protein